MTVLNRIVSIEHPTIARDDFGGVKTAWKPFDTVWADKRAMKGTERFRQDSNRMQSLRMAVFTIRHRDDIFEVYRLRDDDGVVWDIKGVSDLGHQWTELTCFADVSALAPAT